MHLQIICKLFQGEVALMFLVFEALTWLTGGPWVGDIEVDIMPPEPRGAPPNSPQSVH